MSGGITQLVAVGVQDTYLSGSPEVSFFRSTYKRYTHFAASVERQLIQGTVSANAVSLVRFEKKGDLLSHVYFTASNLSMQCLDPTVDWSKIISKVELMIGGQVIDTHNYEFDTDVEPVVGAQTFSNRYLPDNNASKGFYPLKFFFCKDWQSAIPIVALQYHDVELRITWGSSPPVDSSGNPYLIDCWSRFIYLDNDEREFFAKNSHDMLITQLQQTIIPRTKYMCEFALAQPVKYVAFPCKNYTNMFVSGDTNIANAKLKIQINGNDIGENRMLYHWSDINQYYHTPYGYYSTGFTSNPAAPNSNAFTVTGTGNPIVGMPVVFSAPAPTGLTASTVTYLITSVTGKEFTIDAAYTLPTSPTTFSVTAGFAGLTGVSVTFAANSPVITLGGGANTTSIYVGAPVTFTAGTYPPGILTGVTYYVTTILSNTTFEVSISLGGTPVEPTSTGTTVVCTVPAVTFSSVVTSGPMPGTTSSSANVAIIPFCLETSKLQPTGSLNFSRIDTFRLIMPSAGTYDQIISNGSQYFYSVNYNILRIQNGMGGILYAS
jgi:hypothetical protein